jgi:uncharacterized membrane protein
MALDGQPVTDRHPLADKVTQAERLMKIETLLERLIDDVEKIRAAQEKDQADLAALKNKGAGILIGVSIVAGLIGAKLGALFTAIAGAFK